MRLSVIIPAYKEPYLHKTVASLLDTSELGDQLEIIIVLDGPWLEKYLWLDPRVRVLQLEKNMGMRAAINAGISISWGEYIMKVDAHCAFDQGFDRKMLEKMKENRLLVPRRYTLDAINWKVDKTRPRDYHYFEFPRETKYGTGLAVQEWLRGDRDNFLLDDILTLQGSCWMANKKYFMEHVGLLDDRKETYGSFVGEQHEVGLKYWLGGGEVKVTKETWYAHLFKRPVHYPEGYDRSYKEASKTAAHHTWVKDHWVHDREPGMKYPFAWLIKKFYPIPTWMDNWQQLLK